ncbi:MAG: DUF368 domain-containing protein [Candidatus Saccharibacteria bacterium]|nr:DUF368 domain-containing protein [Candidatus Saccharibacteria bacterium]
MVTRQAKNTKLSNNSSKSNRKFNLFGIGAFMGLADLVPGVSGGTIAFIFGIYEELVAAIKSVTSKTITLTLKGNIIAAFRSVPFNFLVPLLGGIVLAIFTMAGLVSYLIDNHTTYIYAAFFGLIVGSVYVVSQRLPRWRMQDKLALVAGAVSVFLIVGLTAGDLPATPLVFFLTGLVAFCAMILPGISGSLIMLIIGSYTAVLQAVSDKNISLLLFLVIGGAIGLALFSRLLSWLLLSHHNVVVALLIGMMIGSLRKVWPWQEIVEGDLTRNVLPSIDLKLLLVFIIIVVAAILIVRLGQRGIIHDHRLEDIRQ